MKGSIEKATWDGLIDILHLLMDVASMYERWQERVFKLFTAVAKRVKRILPLNVLAKLPIIENQEEFK
jgi:hypothetical protein